MGSSRTSSAKNRQTCRLKFVIDAEGSGGAFDTDYSFDSSVTLAYEYDDASGGDDGDGTGGDGTRGRRHRATTCGY